MFGGYGVTKFFLGAFALGVAVFLVLQSILFLPLFIYIVFAHIIDYQVLKKSITASRVWDLNISCGGIDGGGVNADLAFRNVPNFVLISDPYHLPFKDKQFKRTLCSHTIEHVDDPERFFAELKRVSEHVTLLVPPLWDIGTAFDVLEHKWQYLTLHTKHVDRLPPRIKLSLWWWVRSLLRIDAGP